jgi:signal transduction histidine kinase
LAIFIGIVVRFRSGEKTLIRNEIVGREAAALYPEALQQIAENEANEPPGTTDPAELLSPVLKTANQEGMLAVVIFNPEGAPIRAVPANLVMPELSPTDYPILLGGEPINRYTPDYSFGRYFVGSIAQGPTLEVLFPLHGRDAGKTLGFVQYFIDATKLATPGSNSRSLALELSDFDRSFDRETSLTLGVGAALIAGVLATGYIGVARAQRIIAERNERLVRANFELTLAAKASALGQITSHLIHGLQGPVAGLRAVVAERAADAGATSEWRSAANYTERLQSMIEETVALLGDASAQVSYTLTGSELAETIRRRNAAAAAEKKVELKVEGPADVSLDSHRGSIVCLIAANLMQNAIAATPAGRKVEAILRKTDGALVLVVADEGPGIAESARPHLFEPGQSSRPGGSGLGLAISLLLARQIGALLSLAKTDSSGAVFQLTVPL